MFVHEIMTASPLTASPAWTLERALSALASGDFRHLPVVDDSGDLVGILSERDLRAQVLPALAAYELPEDARALMRRRVADIMSGDVLSVHTQAEVSEVIELMLDQRVGALPVVEADTGELVGIVSYVDVLRAAQSLF